MENKLEVDAGMVIDNLLFEITGLTKDRAILTSQIQQLMKLVEELREEIKVIEASKV